MANQTRSKEFLVGAAVGGLLGSVSALLLAPKSGKKLRTDIQDMYGDVSEKTQDMADHVAKQSQCFAKNVSSQTCDWADKAKCLVSSVTNWMNPEETEEDNMKALVMGSVLGGVLGAVAGLMLAPKAGTELRDDLVGTYNDVSKKAHHGVEHLAKKGQNMAKKMGSKTNKWLDLAQDLFEEFTGNAQEKGEELIDKGGDLFNNGKVKEILHWASLGARLWQHVNKKG